MREGSQAPATECNGSRILSGSDRECGRRRVDPGIASRLAQTEAITALDYARKRIGVSDRRALVKPGLGRVEQGGESKTRNRIGEPLQLPHRTNIATPDSDVAFQSKWHKRAPE